MLYVVPTPIGNLDDITLRAIKLFEKAKIVLCEDGRVTSKLFNLIGIKNKPHFINIQKNLKINESGIKEALKSCQKVNHGVQLAQLTIDEDQNIVCLVSDAGTPAISDPGFEVLEIARSLDVDYTTLPGATAMIPAIVNSNLVGKEFWFMGFLPLKKGRLTKWKLIASSEIPVIIYESVHRIAKFVEESKMYINPNSKICICQELTKSHENNYITTIKDLDISKINQKGEFVIVIEQQK
jgi:16S rRNA (cytidine1402-2'-O)-methyltransferase